MAIAVANNTVTKKQQALFVRGFKAWCENTSTSTRSKLGLDPQESLSPHELAEKLHVLVWTLNDVPDLPAETLDFLASSKGDEWSAVTVCYSDQNIIIVNPRHSIGRTSSDLMHELSHIILNHKAGETYFSGDFMMREYDEKQEAEADWLAGTLLLPRKALEYIKYNHLSDEHVTDTYGVSSQLYIYRCRMTAINRQYSH
jgi:Zn-dependent peptidase ImmA (M78 family)